jgi:hypothetical protein
VLGAAFLATVGLVGVLIVLLLGHDQLRVRSLTTRVASLSLADDQASLV